MEWFIKALRHYADFSGRARRKEYWMFLLVNLIFALAFVLLMTFVFMLVGHYRYGDEITGASAIAGISYFMMVMLPSMAVSVRRLHDTGRSGWMLLVGLIPVVGGIWLLVLMLTEGQPDRNEYGADPKTSPATFHSKTKMTSAALTLIVASGASILATIIHLVIRIELSTTSIFKDPFFWLLVVSSIVISGLLLTAGILLLKERQIYWVQKKGRNAMKLILAAVSISFLLTIWEFVSNLFDLKWMVIAYITISAVLSLMTAALATDVLLLNKNRVRKAAIWVIILSGIKLLWFVYLKMDIEGNMGFYRRTEWDPELIFILYLFSILDVLHLIARIVLAGTFLLKNNTKKSAVLRKRGFLRL